MTEENTFPFFIHVFTIPLTLGIGFFLGWTIRGAVADRYQKRKDKVRGGVRSDA